MKLLWTKCAKETYGLLKTDAPELAERVKSLLKFADSLKRIIFVLRGRGYSKPTQREKLGTGRPFYAVALFHDS